MQKNNNNDNDKNTVIGYPKALMINSIFNMKDYSVMRSFMEVKVIELTQSILNYALSEKKISG